MFARYLMVEMPKALTGVRSIGRLQEEPFVEAPARISATGESVTVRFSFGKTEARRADETLVTEPVEIQYGIASDLWVRFTAKVALGCAALLFKERWLETPIASALRDLLWGGRIDTDIWPQGVPGFPGELSDRHPLRRGLGDDRHLIGIVASRGEADDHAVAIAALFGGQIFCRLPLPGVEVRGSGTVWVIDWHPGAPPRPEDFDATIERLLRERGIATDPEVEPLSPRVLAAIDLFRQAPVGQQLADPRERKNRGSQACTRFLSALREAGCDGQLLIWAHGISERSAIQITGTETVVDWACDDPDHPFPLILHRDTADAQRGASHVYEFEDPFYRGRGMPELVLPWSHARNPIPPRP